MSPSSPEALYHPLPQAPVAANPVLPSAPRLDSEDVDEADESWPGQQREDHVTVDSRLWWINCLLGIFCTDDLCLMLRVAAIITATPYFLSRLEGSPLQRTFSSYLSTSFTASNFVFLAFATVRSKQIFVTLIGLSVLSALLSISTFIRAPPGAFFAFVILNGVVQAAFGSFLQSSVIAVASLFGPPAVQALMSGQAAVAVAISIVQVISAAGSVWTHDDSLLLSDGTAEARSAFVFFTLSALYLLVVAGAHAWMVAQPVYRSVASALEPHRKADGTPDERHALVSAGPTEGSASAQIWRVARSNVLYEIAVAYVFVVTLSVFPPITISVEPVNPSFHPLLFSAVHFLMFGLGDFIGRYMLSYPRLVIWDARRLLVLSLARTLFVPLFLLCNIQTPSSDTLPSSPLINSDALFMLLLFLFAMSNGFVSSSCMMAAPSLEHNARLRGRKEDVDVAATVATFCLVGGLALGSIASFVVRGAICACNPFAQ
ncbi:nucleoside transporter-domain-containing protein [Schizophyllum amplum]|uniref:Nucleoside transporter-domain-containing protein n=1 Tax=Schizophyllum amplum TaxID=97359 RepID=A0A550CUM3_9AGAR|nr:nucleoside transporter-domain-containing protein [Auriculariopsis ampla]